MERGRGKRKSIFCRVRTTTPIRSARRTTCWALFSSSLLPYSTIDRRPSIKSYTIWEYTTSRSAAASWIPKFAFLLLHTHAHNILSPIPKRMLDRTWRRRRSMTVDDTFDLDSPPSTIRLASSQFLCICALVDWIGTDGRLESRWWRRSPLRQTVVCSFLFFSSLWIQLLFYYCFFFAPKHIQVVRRLPRFERRSPQSTLRIFF